MRGRTLGAWLVTTVVAVSTVVIAPPATAAFAFLPVESYALTSPWRPKVADLNGDAHLDMVAGNLSSASVGIMTNDGDGTFTETAESTVGATVTCNNPGQLDVGNVDSNDPGSAPDIVTSCLGTPYSATLIGDGAGGFSDPIVTDLYAISNFTTLGNFNSAGPGLDVVHQGFGGSIYTGFTYPFCGGYGDGDGTFSDASCLADQPGGEIIAADIHGTGQDVPIFPSDDVVRFIGYDALVPGGWYAGSTRPTGSKGARELDTGDLDSDADLDLVVLNGGDGNTVGPSFSVLKYDAGAGFDPNATPQVTTTGDLYPWDFALGDFDNDGNLDAAAIDNGAYVGSPNIYKATLAIFAGNGDGTFDAPQLFPAGTNGSTHWIVAADFDADGQDDVAIADYSSSRVEVYRSGEDETPPVTTITAPTKTVFKTSKRSINVRFEFSADEAATFRCQMDDAGFAPCSSGDTYRVRRGSHLFEVYATDAANNVEAPPKAHAFRVKRR